FMKPLWLPDGSGLVALGQVFGSNQNQIVTVAYPSGKVTPVTRDTNSYIDLSVAGDGHTIATVAQQSLDKTYVLPADGDPTQAREFPIEGFPPYTVSWTADGQLLLSTPEPAVALLNPTSGAVTPLLRQVRFPGSARSCPDGHILFMAAAETKIEAHIFRADADGANVQELTHGKLDQVPTCSADSKTVLYQDADFRLEKVSITGGHSQTLPKYPDFNQAIASPDGKLVAMLTFRLGQTKEDLALVPMDFSQPIRFVNFERPHSQYPGSFISFSNDGSGIIYPVREGQADNLWLQPLNGSPGKQLTHFQSEFIGDFSYSRDGKQLAIIRGHRQADVVLMRDAGK
ncbi:MAG TPA: hypothetical protein VJS11_06080, partial [Acidobacteriaceae bacterium]|nr:hypothetical protein [Acidobacteriaceae bacterium]